MSTFTDAQKLAIAAKGNVLVSAGAGTGKTRTVVERCVRLIADENCSLENILMVTFTEAAAAEMRERLRKELEKMRSAECGVRNDEDAPATKSATRILNSALEEQLALLDLARISTLHGFCLELVRDEFHTLGIDPQVNVLDDGQAVPLIHETLDALLERCYRGEASFASGVQRLIRLTGGSDERVRALVLKLHRYTQSRPDAAAWVENQLAEFNEPEPRRWRDWLVQEFLRWRDEWLPQLERYCESANVKQCFDAISGCVASPTLNDAAAVLECIRVADKETEWEWGSKKHFRNPIEDFFDEAAFLGALTRVRDGRDPLAEDWQWAREPMIALLELTHAFTEEFSRAKRSLGGVDFADLEQLALKLLRDENGEPTETALRLQNQFTHVFVDECQDINAAQDAIISAVSKRSSESVTGNRFLVGDVKQSIYRFRLAEPEIFRAYERAWRDERQGKRIALSENFRSRGGLLQFVNALFGDIMRESVGGVAYDDDAKLQFGETKEREPLRANGEPRVELHVIHKVKDNGDAPEDSNGDADASGAEDLLSIEKEARLIARRVRELRESKHEVWDETLKAMRPVDWRDIVVLLRSPRSRVEAFAKEFSRAGVPLSAERAGFYAAIEVQDLLNLFRLLDNPLQDIPLAAVLRSPLGGFSFDELAAVRIAANGDGHDRFFAAANRVYYKGCADEFALGKLAADKLTAFYKRIAHWRRLAQQTSLSQCIETVLAETHYEALLLAQPRGRERLANVRRLLELARQYDPFQRQGLYRFLRFVAEQEDAEIDEEAAAVESENAVRLMSIHASKGLEFPVVVLGCLGSQFNFDDLKQDILLDRELGLCPKVTPPGSEERYPSLAWWIAKRRTRLELLGEELRLLYVAMTRARDTLILTAYDKSKTAEVPWGGGESITEKDLADVREYFGWLRRWLDVRTTSADWSNDVEGANGLLRWRRIAENDSFFSEKLPAVDSANQTSHESVNLTVIQQRLAWTYTAEPATREPAKTNVSALRHRATEADDEVRFIVPRRTLGGDLSAAQVGSAHHTFLQCVNFERVESELDVRNQAQQLVEAGLLSEQQRAALNFDALLAFWNSPLGRDVRANPGHVHRELPFTAKFSGAELRALGLPIGLSLDDELVIVQGVADLAVVLQREIWLVDFKTDHFAAHQIDQKADVYRPQLACYALALERIYLRPVTRRSLYFLAHGVAKEV